MDRMLVLNAQLPIARGHRVEVTEVIVETRNEPVLMAVVDLETGVRFRRAEEPRGELVHWLGRVLDCTVTFGGPRDRTVLVVDADGDGPGGVGARAALTGADAAVEAAKAEADRWGGGDRMPEPEPERFW